MISRGGEGTNDDDSFSHTARRLTTGGATSCSHRKKRRDCDGVCSVIRRHLVEDRITLMQRFISTWWLYGGLVFTDTNVPNSRSL